MTCESAESFCKDQIEQIVHQIREPKTAEPHREIPELVAELVYWNDQLRAVERVRYA